MKIEIREEGPDDIAAIRDVHTRAFGQDQEASIVDALRANGASVLSLVAVLDDEVVGHITFSPASVPEGVTGAALGPMAVLPECQRRGIGSQLVDAGNRRLKDAGCPFIVVVGHPAYYPRFGFQPASTRGLTCEWDVPDSAFLVCVLEESRMGGISGLVRFRREFSSLA